MRTTAARAQRGAALVVALIFLMLLMATVAIAFRMSNTNLKAVGNMQGQAEAQAAAEKAVERLISSDAIFVTPAATTQAADEHGVTVTIAAPECIRTTPVYVPTSGDATPNILIEGNSFSSSGYVDTHWNIRAVAEADATGARVEVNQGIRLVMPETPNPCP
jgi:Tfp pilus assembly protein PilX